MFRFGGFPEVMDLVRSMNNCGLELVNLGCEECLAEWNELGLHFEHLPESKE